MLTLKDLQQLGNRRVVFQKAAQVGMTTLRRVYVEWLADQWTIRRVLLPHRLNEVTRAIRAAWGTPC